MYIKRKSSAGECVYDWSTHYSHLQFNELTFVILSAIKTQRKFKKTRRRDYVKVIGTNFFFFIFILTEIISQYE